MPHRGLPHRELPHRGHDNHNKTTEAILCSRMRLLYMLSDTNPDAWSHTNCNIWLCLCSACCPGLRPRVSTMARVVVMLHIMHIPYSMMHSPAYTASIPHEIHPSNIQYKCIIMRDQCSICSINATRSWLRSWAGDPGGKQHMNIVIYCT